MNMNKEFSRSFGMRDKVGYAFGDLANCLTFTLCSMFFLKFYEEVVGIAPAITGAFMMGCKFFDAFTDVAMGEICDRSRPTKKGRFAPWVLRFSGPVCLAAFLMFAPWVKNWAMPAKIFWMVFTYILYGSICYTGVNIPYGSMANAISGSPKDRTELSNFRCVGSQIGSTLIGVFLPMIAFKKVGNESKIIETNVTWIVVAFACVAFALYLLCYFMCTERVKVNNKSEKFSLIKVFKTWVMSKSVLVTVIATIICLTGTTFVDSMKMYIFPNVFGNADALSLSNLINLGVTLLLSALMLKLTNKFGRKSLVVIGLFFISGIYVLLAAIQLKNLNIVTFLVLYSIAFAGNAVFNLACWAMVGDVIDDAEVKNKRREDGSIYGAYSFSRKMGQALAAGVSGGLLSLIGVRKGVTWTIELKTNLFRIATIVPAALFFITALLFLFLYPLGKQKVIDNANKLRHIDAPKDSKK